MKRVVWIAVLLAVGLALPIAPCQAQVRNDLAVVYEPATGAMRLEFTGTGSLALTTCSAAEMARWARPQPRCRGC